MARKRSSPSPGLAAAIPRPAASRLWSRASVAAPLAPAPRPSRLLPLALSLVLALATVAVYARVRSYGFIEYDDNCYVYDNPVVKDGLTPAGVAWAFTTFHGANWHPLTWLSHMLDVTLFGIATGAYHLVNVAFHTASAVLLFLAFFTHDRAPLAQRHRRRRLRPPPPPRGVRRLDRRAQGRPQHLLRRARPRLLRALCPAAVAPALPPANPLPRPRPHGQVHARHASLRLPAPGPLAALAPLAAAAWQERSGPVSTRSCPLFAVIAASSVVTFIAQRSGGAVSSLTRLPLSDRLATAAHRLHGLHRQVPPARASRRPLPLRRPLRPGGLRRRSRPPRPYRRRPRPRADAPLSPRRLAAGTSACSSR